MQLSLAWNHKLNKLEFWGTVEWQAMSHSFYIWGHSRALISVKKSREWCMFVGGCHWCLSPCNAISCVTADWIPYLHLYISLNGGHIEHIVWIQAVFTFFPRVQTYHGAHYISVSIEGGKKESVNGKPVGVLVICIVWGPGCSCSDRCMINLCIPTDDIQSRVHAVDISAAMFFFCHSHHHPL